VEATGADSVAAGASDSTSYEKRVKTNIESRVASFGMEDQIFQRRRILGRANEAGHAFGLTNDTAASEAAADEAAAPVEPVADLSAESDASLLDY